MAAEQRYPHRQRPLTADRQTPRSWVAQATHGRPRKEAAQAAESRG